MLVYYHVHNQRCAAGVDHLFGTNLVVHIQQEFVLPFIIQYDHHLSPENGSMGQCRTSDISILMKLEVKVKKEGKD